MKTKIKEFLLPNSSSIQQTIECINKNAKGIALIVDEQRHLLGTITDGDIRRATLAKLPLTTSIIEILDRKANTAYSKPITALANTPPDELLHVMRTHVIRQLPLLSERGHVIDLVTWEDLLPGEFLPLQAVILGGGQPTRLHPLTKDLPKPMLPVGNRPLLELTVNQLRRAGIQHVNLTTHYKPESVREYFGDGGDFDVQIQYLNEARPLGTAGALSMLSPSEEPLLVINGDVLTRIDYRAMLDFHQEQEAVMTIAVRPHEFQIPYGVIEISGSEVKAVREKPSLQRFINAGVYLLNPEVLGYLPSGQPSDMPDLINRLVADGHKVASFPVHEYWLDIKDYEDYQQALDDAERGLFVDLEQAALQFEPGAPAPPGFIPLSVPEIRGNEWAYIKECLDTNWVSSVGAFVTRFEELVADYVGAQYGVATSTGTAALHIALLVAGVQPDDEVLVSALTFIAPANAIRYVGAWPVFVDAEPMHWQMDSEKVSDFLEKQCQWRNGALYNKTTGRRVSAIIPVHILGHPCDMDPIVSAARKYNIKVIEDATESLGAKYRGRMVGQLGDIACFSFNGNKIITTGGGGMIVTDNEAWAHKAKYLTTQAKDDPVEYTHKEIGYNYRLTNIQAAMGCAQMEQLPKYIETKRKIAVFYKKAFAELPGIQFFQSAEWAESTYWLANVQIDPKLFGVDSRELMRTLAQHSIQARPLWRPMPMITHFRDYQSLGGEVASRLNEAVLSLPSSVGISEGDLQRVREAIYTIP